MAMVDMKSLLFSDVDRELNVTRDVLTALPEGAQLEWKAHAKSMSLGQLASHVADMPDWCRAALAADELDVMDAPRPPAGPPSKAEILERFDRSAVAFKAAVDAFDGNQWHNDWTMRHGTDVLVTKPRPVVYRLWCMNHLIHHRGQLCVLLRLLDLPVPTVYFNTADDKTMRFE